MGNLLAPRNGDFEAGDDGNWELTPFVGDTAATIEADVGREPSIGLQLRHVHGGGFDPPQTRCGARNGGPSSGWLTVVPDTVHTLSFWVKTNQDSINGIMLEVLHYPNGSGAGPIQIALLDCQDDLSPGWNKFTYEVTPTQTTDAILFRTWNVVPFEVHSDPFYWWIDDASYSDGTAVAIRLQERSIDAIETLMQAQLATELTAIDTDRVDSLVMSAPADANYYVYAKPEIAGPESHVELIAGDIDFTNPYADAAANRATYDIPVTIRVTWFNRNQDTREQMERRGWRYACGVFNVFSNSPELGDSDDATIHGIVVAVRQSVETLEVNKFKGRVTLEAVVRCEEVQ